jgi:phosphate transport system substrate-binding protein
MTRLLRIFGPLLVLALIAGCAVPPPVEAPSAAARSAEAREAAAAQISPDALPPYAAVAGLSGKITSIGASTTTNLVAHAATEFRRIYPDVKLQVTAELASVGPIALLEGRADIVPMSRPLQPEEIRDFQAKYGYPPSEIKVAADALAIFVEKRNPVRGLTLDQLDGIFSRTQRRGTASIETWGQAGLTGEWRDRRIVLYGYGPRDGANQIFREEVLKGGEYRLLLVPEPAGSAIVQDIAADPLAIGYASIFFASKRTRTIPLAGTDGQFYAPTQSNVRGGRYPLSRFLYICVNKPPQRPLDRPAAEFLRFLLSLEGQQIVAAGGNIPLDAAIVHEGRRALE